MRAPGIGFTCVLVLLGASVANAAPPAAPQVTLGADLKLLRFDWDPVPGATFYRLWIKPGGTRYISVGERIPASITQAEHAIPVHLRDWARTRYVVTACNSAGCTGSRPLNPQSLMLDTIGYLKASNTDPRDGLGIDVVVSADGYTLAVSATGEASNASGVNGNQADNSSGNSGAVYVFRRRGNIWQQEAYLKAGVNQEEQVFGGRLRYVDYQPQAISADGSMLAVGAAGQDVNGVEDAGAVYVYRRQGSTWSLMATLHASPLHPSDWFGHSVDMSHDGRTLKVNGIQPIDERGSSEMRTYIFVRPGNTWQFSQTLAPFYPEDACQSVRLSGDGNTLVSSCFDSVTFRRHLVTMKRAGNAWTHVSDTPADLSLSRQQFALSPDATVLALNESSSVVGIYRWDGATWRLEAGIPAPTADPSSPAWGWDLALGNNGRLLAVGNPSAFELGAGVSPTLMPGSESRGAVYLYQRSDSTAWALRAVVKSPNPAFNDYFAYSISLSDSGRTLAAGAIFEDSGSTGIDGDREDESATDAGAAYLY
jgi:hypothetical protein